MAKKGKPWKTRTKRLNGVLEVSSKISHANLIEQYYACKVKSHNIWQCEPDAKGKG